MISKAKREKRKLYDSKRRQRPERRARQILYDKQKRLRYPERMEAQAKLRHEIRMGRIKRGSCLICGKPNAEAHHEDYEKPLSVIWLCSQHHKDLHFGYLSL
jgi:hypothetical protein